MCYAVLIWSTTTVPVNGATFRSDHIVLLAKHPVVPHTIIDVNDGTATCDYDRYAASEAMMTSTSQLTPVADVSSQSTSDDKLRDLAVFWGPVRSSWSSFAAVRHSFAVLCGPVN